MAVARPQALLSGQQQRCQAACEASSVTARCRAMAGTSAGLSGTGGSLALRGTGKRGTQFARSIRRQAVPDSSSSAAGGSEGRKPGLVGRRRLLSTVMPVVCCACPNCRRRFSFMDRSFAEAMAFGMADYELAIAPMKRRLFAQLLDGLQASAVAGVAAAAAGAEEGSAEAAAGQQAAATSSSSSTVTLLEVGIGTGPNLPYYRRSGADLRVLGVDPNPFMRGHLQQAAQRTGWPDSRLSWLQGEAEQLPLPDASVDAAVCTLVLCSVASVPAALAEVRRVLRPGGRLLFIEHTRAPQDASPLLRLGQFTLNPLQQLLADGCHLDRDPLPDIRAAGFSSVEAQRFEVEGMGLIAPHVAGIATA